MSTYIVGLDQLHSVSRLFDSISRKAPEAASIAINRGALSARTQGNRLIRQNKKLQATYIYKHLRVTEKASRSRLQATIGATVRETLLSRYNMKQQWGRATLKSGKKGKRKRMGVTFQVNTKGGRRYMKDAFIIDHLRTSGAPGIARRWGARRHEYKVLHTTSVYHAWKDVIPQVIGPTKEIINDELHRQLDRMGIF